jgi:flagellar basal body-associated protein FliL
MKSEAESETPEAEATTSPATKSWWGQFGQQLAVVLLVLWTLFNALAFAYFHVQARPVAELPSPEIALGDYKARLDNGPRQRAGAARFALHVAFTPQTEQAARERLNTRKYRLQQDIEELLRRAQSVDFEDPRLREIKRQIHEQINETLGMRAVADVIITGLAIESSDSARAPSTATVTAAEKPGG